MFSSTGSTDEPQVLSPQSAPSCSYQPVIVDGRGTHRIPKIPAVRLSSPPPSRIPKIPAMKISSPPPVHLQSGQSLRKRPPFSSRSARRVCNSSGYWTPQQVESESQDELYQDVESPLSHSASPIPSSIEQGPIEIEQEIEPQNQLQQVRDEHSYPEHNHDAEVINDDDDLIVEDEISCIMEDPVRTEAGELVKLFCS